MNQTNLILNIVGFPPESARNCVQELSPIPNGEFRKSINGDLMFLEGNSRKRYKSVISCNDVNSPLTDGVWIGSHINVGCIQHLWQRIEPQQTSVVLMRPAVDKSVCVVDNFGAPIKHRVVDNSVELCEPRDEAVFVCFRPWLSMIVKEFSLQTDEWNMSCGWRLVLEEV